MRLVLDTNVLASGLLYPGGPPSRLVKAWRAHIRPGDLRLRARRTGEHLAAPGTYRLSLTPNDPAGFMDITGVRAESIRINADMLSRAAVADLRDPNELPILATLIGSAADFLVTGDKDLLTLAGAHPIPSPAGFVGRFVP